MQASDLYRDLVIAHNRAPRRFAPIAGATHTGRGANPMCGDDLGVRLHVADGRIVDLGFDGEGCAVCIAAASMLGEALAGAEVSRPEVLRAAFARLLEGGEADPALGDLRALAGLRDHPARQRCAWLAFDAVASALAGGDAS
jgi:nitrogen fixation NifU-like protein